VCIHIVFITYIYIYIYLTSAQRLASASESGDIKIFDVSRSCDCFSIEETVPFDVRGIKALDNGGVTWVVSGKRSPVVLDTRVRQRDNHLPQVCYYIICSLYIYIYIYIYYVDNFRCIWNGLFLIFLFEAK
jgi:hypothetical protein